LVAEQDQGANPKDPDEHRANGISWVPKVARWPSLQGAAKQPTNGKFKSQPGATHVFPGSMRRRAGLARLPPNFARTDAGFQNRRFLAIASPRFLENPAKFCVLSRKRGGYCLLKSR
jgi:hypothetical protein